MIVSSSRRTDIPAYYAPWFMGRIAAGYCLVANPFDARRITRVSLKGEDVDFLVFWTRDPRPLIPHLSELEERGIRFYFQMTISGYPPEIEPGAPPFNETIGAMRELISALGSRRVIWRYDPILVARPDGAHGPGAPALDADWHRRNFEFIASGLESGPERIVFSVLDEYSGTARALERSGYYDTVFGSPRKGKPRLENLSLPEPYPSLLADLAAIARSKGMMPTSCAEPFDLSPLGIQPGACVDRGLAVSIWGKEADPEGDRRKNSGQRGDCLCAPSVDIGSYGSCPRGCAYCYASRGRGKLLSREREDEKL